MIQRRSKRLSLRALIVDDELGTHTAEDGTSVVVSDSAIHAILIEVIAVRGSELGRGAY